MTHELQLIPVILPQDTRSREATPVRTHGESGRIKWVCLEVVYSKAVLEPSLLLLSFIKLSFSGIYPICIYIPFSYTPK
jgi:hypothetical protein